MPKFFFKRVLPSHDAVNRQRMLRPLSRFFGGAAIWRVNRRSIAIAMAIGVFCGALPVPIQMLLAGVAAIVFQVNLPAAMLATFWSNPFTMPAIFYLNYRIGAWLLGSPVMNFDSGIFTFETLHSLGGRVLLPLFSGSLVVGAVLAPIVYAVIIWWWRGVLIRHRRRRRGLRLK